MPIERPVSSLRSPPYQDSSPDSAITDSPWPSETVRTGASWPVIWVSIESSLSVGWPAEMSLCSLQILLSACLVDHHVQDRDRESPPGAGDETAGEPVRPALGVRR